MANKHFTALIIDQDPGQSDRMVAAIDKIFTTVTIESKISAVEKEFVESKPDALFFNIHIAQRETSFVLMERLLSLTEIKPLVFAYTDGHEPELIAHAIENGVLDVFMRPFDADVVASKVNRFLRDEGSKVEKDLLYTKLYRPLKAEVQLGTQIVSVDENGITLSSDHYLSKGTKFKINSPIVKEIFGVDETTLMVSKTWFNEELSIHFLFAEPREQKESYNAAMRRFITGKT